MFLLLPKNWQNDPEMKISSEDLIVINAEEKEEDGEWNVHVAWPGVREHIL